MTANEPNAFRPDTIVLIHGLWLTPRCWEHWIERYAAAGFETVAPAWPGMEVEVEELRRDPSVMNSLGVIEVADHYEQLIRKLDSPPIIMGHSFGGAITQILLDRGPRLRGRRNSSRTDQGCEATAHLELAFRDAGAEEPGEPQTHRATHA
jgi:pimeloyl-ACP methyl ester carboxylesterase